MNLPNKKDRKWYRSRGCEDMGKASPTPRSAGRSYSGLSASAILWKTSLTRCARSLVITSVQSFAILFCVAGLSPCFLLQNHPLLHICSSLCGKNLIINYYIHRLIEIGGFQSPEPKLGAACCISSDLSRPIGKLEVNDWIWSQTISVPTKAGCD